MDVEAAYAVTFLAVGVAPVLLLQRSASAPPVVMRSPFAEMVLTHLQGFGSTRAAGRIGRRGARATRRSAPADVASLRGRGLG